MHSLPNYCVVVVVVTHVPHTIPLHILTYIHTIHTLPTPHAYTHTYTPYTYIAGLTIMDGGTLDEVSLAINNMINTVIGNICEGASVGCFMKAFSGVNAGKVMMVVVVCMCACTHVCVVYVCTCVGMYAIRPYTGNKS